MLFEKHDFADAAIITAVKAIFVIIIFWPTLPASFIQKNDKQVEEQTVQTCNKSYYPDRQWSLSKQTLSPRLFETKDPFYSAKQLINQSFSSKIISKSWTGSTFLKAIRAGLVSWW